MGVFDDEVISGLQELGLGDKPRYVAARGEPKSGGRGDHETVFGIRSMDEALRKIAKSESDRVVRGTTLSGSKRRK